MAGVMGRLGDRAGQRNLSAMGIAQAKALGNAFRTLHIPMGEILTSPVFRARDTGELAFGTGRIEVTMDLVADDYAGSRANLQRMLDATRRHLRMITPPGDNRILIGHRTPFEMVMQVLMQLFVTVIVLGLDPLAAALVGVIAALAGIFQHWNVRTPRWLGYFIQRPESHSRHHERGVHARNYADLPVFDILFGTFHNPRHFAAATGFFDGASSRVPDMLLGRDVSVPAPQQR